MPHLYCPVVTKHADLLPTLEHLLKEIEFRYERFAQYGVENITQRNQESQEKMYSLVIVIDEFADLLDSYDYS
jgi:S-DNA-T family DNA segregation ATPase FtsK/SpoIIIE